MNRTTQKYIREAAALHAEQARRLARYDEALRLLRELKTECAAEIQPDEYVSSNAIYVCGKVEDFLDAEPLPGRDG